jgi:hypothetical protein
MNTNRCTPNCVYCGHGDGETVDHVPPKLLLARPYPKNLLTVPACRKCNASFQTNDEYTRFVVAVDLRTAEQPDAQSKMPAIMRSLQKPEALGFARYLLSQMTDTTVLGPNGRPMAQAVEADRARLNATGERMVRGLFFIESGEPLPPSTKVRIAAKPGISHSNDAIQHFARMYAACPNHRGREVGDAFSYAVAFYPQFSVWFLLLYGHFAWLATIGGPVEAAK